LLATISADAVFGWSRNWERGSCYMVWM